MNAMSMMRRALAFSSMLAAACGGGDPASPSAATKDSVTDTRPLRMLADARHVSIGGVTGSVLFLQSGAGGDTLRATLKREFNMVWSGNFLKFATIRPTRATFDYRLADSMVTFATTNGMKVRGHTLVWHNQNPAWLTQGTWTRDQTIAALYEHVDAVVGHYRGKLAAWDVVNEVLNDDGTMRSTLWRDRIGDDYIELAFRRAAAADPSVPLYYNDYNIEGPGAKADSAYALVKRLKNAGVPIDGVGFQGHFVVGKLPTRAQLAANIARFVALGVKVEFTEVDVRVALPSNASALAQQAQDYATIVQACLDVPGCDAVEMASVFDGESWVPGTFPGWGDASLLDMTFARKPAYFAVRGALGG